MPIPKILFTDADGSSFKITILADQPLYQEAPGEELAGMWLPFVRISNQSQILLSHGIRALPDFVKEKICQEISFFKENKNKIQPTFHSLECLILSSQLGGGIWNTGGGQNLKNFLQEAYPGLYQDLPFINIEDEPNNELVSLNADNVNKWLVSNSSFDSINDFSNYILKLDTNTKKRLQQYLRPDFANTKHPLPKQWVPPHWQGRGYDNIDMSSVNNIVAKLNKLYCRLAKIDDDEALTEIERIFKDYRNAQKCMDAKGDPYIPDEKKVFDRVFYDLFSEYVEIFLNNGLSKKTKEIQIKQVEKRILTHIRRQAIETGYLLAGLFFLAVAAASIAFMIYVSIPVLAVIFALPVPIVGVIFGIIFTYCAVVGSFQGMLAMEDKYNEKIKSNFNAGFFAKISKLDDDEREEEQLGNNAALEPI